MRNQHSLLLLASLLIVFTVQSQGQVRVTAGVKGWYATWNIPIATDLGAEQSSYSPALLFGPYISFRFQQLSLTAMYSGSVAHFEAEAKNPGVYVLGYNGNRIVSRKDINFFANYSVTPELTFFANLKLLTYTSNDALTYIVSFKSRVNQKFDGTGFGLGAQITVPFSGGSPFYTFMSTGLVSNSYKSDNSNTTYLDMMNMVLEEHVEAENFSESEMLYFLDAGIGMRFLPSSLGGAIGIRVENASYTKTIIGPTINLFYTF